MRKTLVTFILIVILSQYLLSQELKNPQSKIGIGVSFFNLTEYLFESSVGNTIYLTINRKNNFRLEPSLGFSFTDNQSKFIFGVGAFKQKELTRLNLLTGIRLGLSDSKIYFIAPTLGGEYFFDEHFSLGSEIQIRGSFKRRDFKLLSNTSIMLRFYF
jgi:hypothetical protein